MFSRDDSERDCASGEALIESSVQTRPWEGELLPGEEQIHARLQNELIEKLACSHRVFGLVVEIEAEVGPRGSHIHGMLRSIQAAPGRYSCEFLELRPGTGALTESRFFTIVPPAEERCRASLLVLAKAVALVDCEAMRPVSDGNFDAVLARDH